MRQRLYLTTFNSECLPKRLEYIWQKAEMGESFLQYMSNFLSITSLSNYLVTQLE